MDFFSNNKTLGELGKSLGNLIPGTSIGLNLTKFQDRGEILKIIEQFNNAYMYYYNVGNEQSVEQVKHFITQQFFYNIHLNKQRLRMLQIEASVTIQFVMFNNQDVLSSIMKGADSVMEIALDTWDNARDKVRWNFDGKNISALVRKDTKVMKTYQKNGRPIYSRNHGYGMFYTVVEAAHSSDGNYICPNCGATQTMEQIMSGCSFCKTPFKIEDFRDKVISMEYDHLLNDSDARFYARFLDNKTKYKFISFQNKNVSSLPRIKGFDVNFSMDEFKANIENKMAYVHYAMNQQQIAPFTMINMNGLLQHYGNVLNCNLEEIALTGFMVDQWNQVIYTELLIALERLVADQVVASYEWVRVVFVKNKNKRTQTCNDVMTYKCKNCGGNIDLLSGGTCEHCGTTLNLIAYDWVIGDYVIVEEK